MALGCWGAMAQEIPNTLNPVTITTTRIPMKAQETGRDIQILTAADIAALPVKSIDELLRYLPGVEVAARGPMGVQGDLVIRGSTFSQVLVLVDGMRVNDPLTGHFSTYIPVSLAEISRIEVLKGPASATYGADAVGGVVHIITKTFENEPATQTVSGRIGAGAHGLRAADVGAYASSGTTKIAAGIVSNSSQGFPREGLPPADFNLQTGSFSFSTAIDSITRLSARVGVDSRDFDARYFYTNSAADQARETVLSTWLQAGLARNGKKFQQRVDASYRRTRDAFVFNPTFASTNTHLSSFANLLWQGTLPINERLSAAFSGQLTQRAITSNDRGNHEIWHTGAQSTLHYRTKQLSVAAGLRGDYDRNYGFEVTPQLNAAWQYKRLVLRTAGGRSIRAADFTELYISNNLPGPLTEGRNLGNPFLQAERAWSVEGGADFTITNGIQLSGTYFARFNTNLIDYVITPTGAIPNNSNLEPGSTYFYTTNIATAQTTGYELAIKGVRQLGKGTALHLTAGITQLTTTTPAGVVSKYISNHARTLVTGRVELRHQKFSVLLMSLYKERDAELAQAINEDLTPAYGLLNAAVNWQFHKALGIYLQVNNLGNVRYSDVLGAQMPGRWFMGGVQFGF